MEDNRSHGLVLRQHVTEEKRQIARNMRRNMTVAEAALWSRLRGGALGTHFRRQQNIAGFIADFYCHAAALVMEVDGPAHDAAYDTERDRIFAGHGLTVVRVTNQQVLEEIDWVLEKVRDYLPCHK